MLNHLMKNHVAKQDVAKFMWNTIWLNILNFKERMENLPGYAFDVLKEKLFEKPYKYFWCIEY